MCRRGTSATCSISRKNKKVAPSFRAKSKGGLESVLYLWGMKYRSLSIDELQHLAEDFKQFLIVNEIYHENWVEMNESNPTKAQEVVNIFSDQVLQKVYEKIQYLEFHSTDSFLVFNVQGDQILLVSIQVKDEFKAQITLDTTENIHYALVQHLDKLHYFRTSKKLTRSREEEIHSMIESGCILSTEEFWNSLLQSI